MRTKDSFVQKFAVAMTSCLLAAAPGLGWGAIEVADRPLFLTANVDHNLMFVVDDSGSMDFEVLAPSQGITEGYLFNVGRNTSNYNGQILLTSTNGGTIYAFNQQYFYLRSHQYNLTYYNPFETYGPWPSGSTDYENVEPSAAPLDPNFPNSTENLTANFPNTGSLSAYYPAVFFIQTTNGSVTKTTTTTVEKCTNPTYPHQDVRADRDRCYKSSNKKGGYIDAVDVDETSQETQSCDTTITWYDNWWSNPNSYSFSGDAEALGPDGKCLNKVELREANWEEVLAVTGQNWEDQLQNFANWFTYYRRRHHAIRGAIGEAVEGLQNMRLGMFWMHNRRTVSMLDSDTQLATFLDENYGRFGGNWSGGGTPTRRALNHAGLEFKRLVAEDNALECRKNFALLFTDGYANNHPKSIDGVGNADKNAPQPFGSADGSENHSNTLGDIAYKYYQGLGVNGGAVRVPSECGTGDQRAWMDCNTGHHMNTYTVSFGVAGQKFAGITHHKVMDAHNDYPDWDQLTGLSTDEKVQIDDLYHAAVNGKGEYYDAKSTEQLRSALKSAVREIVKELGSGANVSFNTGTIEEGSRIYSAEFWSGSWVGTLKAQSLQEGGRVGTTSWNAGNLLDARVQNLAANPRNILTYNPDSGSVVSLAWNNLDTAWNGLSTSQKADLKNGGSDDDGKARLKYILGDTSEEGRAFRDRASVLGDIIHSSPVYVGKPAMSWPNSDPFGSSSNRYSKFRSDKENRQAVVYVGANDGMLHGFNADTGQEILGFIPSFVYSTESNKGLHYLTDVNYDHRSYVDLPTAVSDVYIDNSWKSVLIGGGRAGVKGLFALDVTDPSTFTTNPSGVFLWEFTEADANGNLGYMTAEPLITMVKWGDNDYRWSAVFANGYGATSGKNGVFVLDIAGGKNGWESDVNFKFIELATGNGLSPIRVVDYVTESGKSGSDGIADRLYAGDTEGRLWAVSLSGGKSSWGSAYAKPLFTAKNASGQAQPITAQPVVALNTYSTASGSPNLLIYVGTGQYLSASDITNTQVQSMYAVHDRGTADLTRASLEEIDLIEEEQEIDGDKLILRKTKDVTINWAASFGWFIDFDTETGERIVNGAMVRGEHLVFNTMTPDSSDPCGGGGSSWLMVVELDGSTSAKPVLDVTRDGELDDNDAGWAGGKRKKDDDDDDGDDGNTLLIDFGIIGNVVIGSGSDTSKPSFLTDLGGNFTTGRMSWREIVLE